MDTIEYFKRVAKTELRSRRADGQDDLTLMQTQHKVAVDAGFRSWNALRDADEIEGDLAVVMHQHPRLNIIGFGFNQFEPSLAARRRQFPQDRAELRQSAERLTPVCEWLREHVAPRQSVNSSAGSYGIKHMFESEQFYITNGELIAAALIAGYPMREEGGDSPNARFGMSSKSLKMIWRRVYG